jgi:hypothetical protein
VLVSWHLFTRGNRLCVLCGPTPKCYAGVERTCKHPHLILFFIEDCLHCVHWMGLRPIAYLLQESPSDALRWLMFVESSIVAASVVGNGADATDCPGVLHRDSSIVSG